MKKRYLVPILSVLCIGATIGLVTERFMVSDEAAEAADSLDTETLVINPSDPSTETDGVKFLVRNDSQPRAIAVATEGKTYEGSVVIPASIAYEGKDYLVESVFGTFENSKGLTAVSLPNTVKEIGVRTFKDCTHLESINLPDSLLTIGYQAFESCFGLKKLVIPEKVILMSNWVFSNCLSLKDVDIRAKLNRIPEGSFRECISLENIRLPETIVAVEGEAFLGCVSLRGIALPDSVKYIGASAFRDCTNLESVEMGDKVASIGAYAFRGNTNLTQLRLSEGLKTISYRAFMSCHALKTLIIPASVAYMEDCILADCQLDELRLLCRPETGYDFLKYTKVKTVYAHADQLDAIRKVWTGDLRAL